MPKRSTTAVRATPTDYVTLAEFRHALRRFLQFSADAAKAAGLSPQQHQALLAIKGFRDPEHVTIGDLATRMQLRHHSAVGLVDRLEQRRLVQRRAASEDRRRVNIRLTAAGETLIGRLSVVHKEELRQLGPELRRLLDLLDRN
jgi:DNA-binding MarR family transcriptional regulator